MGMPTLATERLVLRPLRLADLDAFAAILGDPETMAYYPHPYTRAETQRWIERDLAAYEQAGLGHLAVMLREGGEFVGDCGPIVLRVAEVDEVELGWHIRRDLWHRGYATEAACAARDWAFGQRQLTRLISLVRPENRASCRVAEKIGMHLERAVDYKGLGHVIYAMSADEPRPLPKAGA
jgi:RimJ/RimL family protein N-acetyltransferase